MYDFVSCVNTNCSFLLRVSIFWNCRHKRVQLKYICWTFNFSWQFSQINKPVFSNNIMNMYNTSINPFCIIQHLAFIPNIVIFPCPFMYKPVRVHEPVTDVRMYWSGGSKRLRQTNSTLKSYLGRRKTNGFQKIAVRKTKKRTTWER